MTTPSNDAGNGNTIQDVRSHLFAALRGLTDKSSPMDIQRALAVSEVSQTIINTAKVEIDMLRVVGGKGGTGFIPLPAPEKSTEKPQEKLTNTTRTGNVLTHRLPG